ncbi:MAG: IMP dehydrogenase [Candidatus Roizmanbacteria bacterium]
MTTFTSNSKIIGNGITYDDVLVLPGYSDFSRSDISTETKLTQKISLKIPLISSPMDTVTESKLAIKLAEHGGIGIIHRNLSIEDQAFEVSKVKNHDYLVGASVGVSIGYEDRIKILNNTGVDLIVLDTAHGYTTYTINAIQFIKKNFPHIAIMAGNIATAQGAEALIKAGADCLRIGMGPGAICTTRIISGMGVPQITALLETSKIAQEHHIPIIADGGIKYSGDIVKALVAGASAVMLGGIFASCEESPGETKEFSEHEIPRRFKSIINGSKSYLFKSYRGMGSIGAMEKGSQIKSEDEYHGKNYKDRVLVAEGVEGYVPVKGTVKDLVDQLLGGIKSGMYYSGAKTINDLHTNGKFIQITHASLTESHPHDILVTNPGKNY